MTDEQKTFANRLKRLFFDDGGEAMPSGLFYALAAAFVAVLLGNVRFGSGFVMDLVEHIHSAWLASTGKVPYRDFFQHHNPLLWYLAAPVTQLFYRDIAVLYAMRLLSVAAWGVVFYQLYALARDYFGGKSAARFALLLLVPLPTVWEDAQNLRPDTLMFACILAGVRLLLAYLDTHKRSRLVWSFVFWSLAFWFLQKAAVPGAGFLAVVLVMLWRGQIRCGDFLLAAAVAVALNGAVIGGLYGAGALEAWYKWNFAFNRGLSGYYGEYTSYVGWWLPFYAILLSAAAIRFFERKAGDFVLLGLMLPVAASLFFFAPHPQYYTLYFLPVSVLAARAVLWAAKRQRAAVNAVAAAVAGGALFLAAPRAENAAAWEAFAARADFVLKNAAEDDKVMNGEVSGTVNLFNPDADYFWFGYNNIMPAAVYAGFADFNYGEAIKKARPKFLFMPRNGLFDFMALWHSKWLLERTYAARFLMREDEGWRQNISQINFSCWPVDMDFVEKNYHWMCAEGKSVCLWVRKAAAPEAVGERRPGNAPLSPE